MTRTRRVRDSRIGVAGKAPRCAFRACVFVANMFVAGVVVAAPPPYYIGDILPTPKRATYGDAFVPVYDVAARRPLVTVVAGESKSARLGAKDFIARVCQLAGAEAPNFDPQIGGAVPKGHVLGIGTALGVIIDPAPDGEQAYAIRSVQRDGRWICVGVGGGDMGTYFAAMSLVQLLKVEAGRVLLCTASVDDWPTFKLRGTCCYTPEQAQWLALARFSTLDMNYGAVGRDAWRNPDAYARPKGWGNYSGAGKLRIRVSTHTPHSGARCIRASVAVYYTKFKDRPDYISAALMLGNTNGYTGRNALDAEPGRYRLALWMRGDVPEVKINVLGWTSAVATRAQRRNVSVEPAAIKPTAQWRHYELKFTLPRYIRKFAPQLRIGGQRSTGYELGKGFEVDDVALVREGSGENLMPNPGGEEAEGYRARVAALWDWAVPRGLWPMQFVNPLNVTGWQDDGEDKIQVSDPEQIDDMARTFRISLDRGGTWILLALDDFASKIGGPAPYYVITNKADRKAFASLGECHGTLVRELYKRLTRTHPHVRMIVCPAYYWIPRGGYKEEGEKYLREFGRLVPKGVLILWTGPHVRSRKIAVEQVRHFTNLIGRKPYLWDNTIYARHAKPTYMLDPFDSEYPNRFWEMTAGGLHNNGGVSEIYKTGCLVYGDYAWNPEAYDPVKSLDKALRMVLGEGCVADAKEFRDHYFAVRDPYYALTGDISRLKGRKLVEAVGPLTAKDIGEIVRHVEAMDAALDRLKAKSPNKNLLATLEGLAARLRNSARVLKKHGDLTANAAKKIPGGLLLPEWAFVGGAGHREYAAHCPPRRATWIYGKRTKTHRMSTSFKLDAVPKAATLVIEGQDCDKPGRTRVRIVLNGKMLYEGPNRCVKRGWSEWRIGLPPGLLKVGRNTLTIANLEDSSSTNARWFMLTQAKIKKAR